MRRATLNLLLTLIGMLSTHAVLAAGGPLGIDHRVNYDDRGAWQRGYQKNLRHVLFAAVASGALWEGAETRIGRTMWQAIDAGIIAAAGAEALKVSFTRARPIQANDPDRWFEGKGHYSFPSGEVATVSGIVAPFIFEHGRDHPYVYVLALLPLYNAIGRVKLQAHWQTDVLTSLAIGAAAGYYSHSREQPFVLSVLPGGFAVGIRKRW
jgi:undecaprenyl-diphosphatase